LALDYTERFAQDHLSITDELFEDLRRYFTDEEILEITVSAARHLAFGRITQVMHVDLACPVGPDPGWA
jgi:alkylhydroperoxidase family enzyme